MLSMKKVKKSMLKACTAAQLRDKVSNEVAGDVKSKKKKKQRKNKKKKMVQKPVETVLVAKEEENVKTSEALEINKLAAANCVEISDNIVLRKLLRGPRYFDPSDSGWRTCYNCGGGGHTTVNCSSVKRKKPCYFCGSLEHHAKQCKKRRDCFICERGGHLAINCPGKQKWGPQNPKKCLKCGGFCHDMFSCKNDYSPDDLKEIQCYICNSFGHLCCAAFGDISRREPSCYRCGQLGHTGLECQTSRGEPNSAGPLSSCFKSGEGHFALECTTSTEIHKRNLDLATPTRKLSKRNRKTEGVRSMPSDSGKSQKRKRAQYEGGRFSTPPNLRQSGGLITEYSGDLQRGYAQVPRWGSPVIPTYNAQVPRWGSPVIPTYNAQVPGWGSPVIPTYNAQVPGWGSPVMPTYNAPVPGWGSSVTPIYNANLISTPLADGRPSSSHFLRRAQELQFGHLASNVSPIFYQDIYPRSINGNFSSYGMRSNHRW